MKKLNPKIMDIASEIAQKKYKTKAFSFYELADEIFKKGYELDTSDLYINMIEDTRFLSIGKQKWKLSSSFDFEEAEKIKMSMFGDKDSYVQSAFDADEIESDEERELAFMEDLDNDNEEVLFENLDEKIIEEENVIIENIEDEEISENE